VVDRIVNLKQKKETGSLPVMRLVVFTQFPVLLATCSKMLHQPGLLPLIICWVVCAGAFFVSLARWISSGEQIELMITVFCGVGGPLGLRSTLKSSSKYKHVYADWVQKHGTNPDDWLETSQA